MRAKFYPFREAVEYSTPYPERTLSFNNGERGEIKYFKHEIEAPYIIKVFYPSMLMVVSRRYNHEEETYFLRHEVIPILPEGSSLKVNLKTFEKL